MPISLILAVIGVAVGGLDLAGIVHLPYGLGIAAAALGVVALIVFVRVLTAVVKLVAGIIVLALAAAAIFGTGILHGL